MVVLPLPSQADQSYIWQVIYRRAARAANHYACKAWLAGRARLALPVKRVPSLAELNQALTTYTLWRCMYSDETPWLGHFLHKVYPISNALRESAEETPLVQADLFHDVFGHLPLLTNPVYTDLLLRFAEAYSKATATQREEIERLAWYSLEYGLVFEQGQARALGGRLISCPNEMDRVLRGDFYVHPFTIDNIVGRYRTRFQTEKTLFIGESLEAMQIQINGYLNQIIGLAERSWSETYPTSPDVRAAIMGSNAEDHAGTALPDAN